MQILIYSDRWLAYTSVLVTISSFVFGTFTQQLIAYVEFPITSGILQPKCIDRLEILTSYTGNVDLTDIAIELSKHSQHLLLDPYWVFDLANIIPLALTASTYNGILSPNIQPLPASCQERVVEVVQGGQGGLSPKPFKNPLHLFLLTPRTSWAVANPNPTNSAYTVPIWVSEWGARYERFSISISKNHTWILLATQSNSTSPSLCPTKQERAITPSSRQVVKSINL